jgi:chromosome segregation ATPase
VHLRDDRLQALQVAEQQVSALREALLGRDASLASERAELGRLQQELSALREELLGRQQELSALREELLCRDNSLSTERAELERLQQELSELRASASCFEQDLATLRHSTSWRITGPVRAAVNLLRGRCDANGER